MRISLFIACLLSSVLFLSPSAKAQVAANKIRVELLVDHETLQPSETESTPAARIGVLLHIEPGWHTYWQNSGEAAIPTRVSWQLPDGFRSTDLRWPIPEKFAEKGSITTYGYRDEVLLWTDIFTEQVLPSTEQELTFAAKVSWLVCKEICVPGQQTVQIEIPYSTSLSLQPSASFPLFEKYSRLTPLNVEEAKHDLKVRALRVREELVTPVEKSQLVVAGFALPGLKVDPEQNITSAFQIFPYLAPGILFQQTSGRLTEEGPLLRLSMKQTGALPKELRGILVLSGNVVGTKEDKAFEWVLPTSGLKSEPNEALLSNAEFAPLSLHAQDTKGHAPQESTTAKGSLLGALFAAFIAGMLLNLMPCVLPIISIKILGFVCHSEQSQKKVLIASLSFAAGILCSFLALALVLISFRSVGFSLGWGFQFQYPQFVAALLLVVFFLSLALFDLYTVNLPFMQNANDACSKVHSPLLKHFFDGVLATALSTPCTAPVLGTALVFAFAQPPIYTVFIFLTIGLGLALPYVYLSTHPKLLKMLPSPGNWMFHFRQFMGFLLLGTCVWLLSVLHDLTQKGAIWGMVLMLLLYFFLWARKCALESKPERGRSPVFNVLFFAALFGSGYLLYPSIVAKPGAVETGAIKWTPFSEAVLEEAKNTKSVFIDFTASWCITCKFNEYRLIETQATADVIAKLGILPVKADWTSGDESITQALKRYGAEGVPLYVILPKKGGEPIVLSTLPSQSSLLDALQKAVE